MMKKSTLIIIFSCFFLVGMTSPMVFAQAAPKIGFVDLSRLFDEYYKTKEYDKVLEAKNNNFEKARNEKVEKVRDAQQKLSVLADDQKKKAEEDIEKLKSDLMEFDRQNKQDLTKERNEKIREILLEIEKIVSDYAQKESYSVILNDRVLIYGNQTLDLTAQILQKLNEGHPTAPASDKK